MVMASAMPTRQVMANQNNATESRWSKENDAFLRMRKAGYDIPHLNGADVLEKNARTEIELKRGKLYGDKAEKIQKIVNEEIGAV